MNDDTAKAGEPDLLGAARSVLQARAVLQTAGILETKAWGVANCACRVVVDSSAIGYNPASAGTTVTAVAADTSRTAVAAIASGTTRARRFAAAHHGQRKHTHKSKQVTHINLPGSGAPHRSTTKLRTDTALRMPTRNASFRPGFTEP